MRPPRSAIALAALLAAGILHAQNLPTGEPAAGEPAVGAPTAGASVAGAAGAPAACGPAAGAAAKAPTAGEPAAGAPAAGAPAAKAAAAPAPECGPEAGAPAEPPRSVAQDMYQDALQSIAEGRKNDASETLQRVIEREPLHAGAWLDLGLMQCALGHQAEAERLFVVIEQRFKPSPGILQLIAEARRDGCDNWTPLSQYSLGIGRGIDQNVNQGSRGNYTVDALGVQTEYELSPDFRPRHDQYTMVSGEYLRDLSPNGTLGFAQYQGRRNDHYSQYDSQSLFAGVETPWRFGKWAVRGTGMAGFITLGGRYYQRQLQGQLRIGPPLQLPSAIQLNVLASLTKVQYVTLENFDSTTGELRAQFSRRSGEAVVNANLGALDDRAVGSRPGGNRHGLQASLQWRRRYDSGFTADLGYSWQTWHSALPYSPGVIEQVREQATHVLRATVSYALDRNQSLTLEARQVRNQENIPIFQYNNRQLQLSWQWQGL
ncbi:tetratricopeptide repeat protein [Oxalobacteraceae bacterium A2-2]